MTLDPQKIANTLQSCVSPKAYKQVLAILRRDARTIEQEPLPYIDLPEDSTEWPPIILRPVNLPVSAWRDSNQTNLTRNRQEEDEESLSNESL